MLITWNHRKINALVLMAVFLHVRCSKVIEEEGQALYVPDYCATTGICLQGTHVLCTHYNPNREMGPLCVLSDGLKISINDEYANILLDLFNGIRSRAARGMTTGLNDYPLPRAYGMIRLQWDPELATMAQVWANQCQLGFDMCRATKKFPDPGQIGFIERFDDDWLPLNKEKVFNKSGFSSETVMYALRGSVRFWYGMRDVIYPGDITDENYGWTQLLLKNAYLQIVHGPVTHTGCGLSMYRDYEYHGEEMHYLYNAIRVICNFSIRVKPDWSKTRVYSVNPPTEVGYTLKCGCPLGYDEDEDCLCYESGRDLPYSCKDKKCKPHVVVLPIFTMENAPSLKYNQNSRHYTSNRRMPDTKKITHLIADENPKSHDLRGSMFLKPSVFELQPRKLKTDAISANQSYNPVRPRRNFFKAKSLALKYLQTMRNKNITYAHMNSSANNFYRSTQLRNHSELNNMKNMHHLVQTENRRIINDTLNTKHNNIKSETLLNLLNKLEEQAKYVQFDNDERDILDRKIKKIYGIFIERALRQNRNVKDVGKQFIRGDFKRSEKLQEFENQRDTRQKIDLYGNIPMIKNLSKINGESDFKKVNLLNDNYRDEMFHNRNNSQLSRRNTYSLQRAYRYIRGDKKYENNSCKNLHKDENLLTFNKRKFYQEKLNNIESKLRDFGNYRKRHDMSGVRQFNRPVLPSYHEVHSKRIKPENNLPLAAILFENTD